MAINRLSGLSSGFDYESIIKKLMTAESAKLNKLKQKKQTYQWQQDIYKDLNTSLLTLKNQAFNMKLSSTYKTFAATSSDSTAVTAAGTSSASPGTYSIVIKQLATTSEMKSASTVSPILQSSSDIVDFNVSGKNFNITFDGTQKNISWEASEGNYANIDALVAGLQSKINNAFGTNQITVSKSGNRIVLNPTDTTFKPNIKVNTGTTNDALAQLNISDGTQSHITLDTQLKDLNFVNGALTFDPVDDKLKFSINGSDFAISKTDTLQSLITTVNGDSNADVTMSYDSSKDIISIKRKTTGAGKDITFTDGTSSNFSTAVGFGAVVEGKNSIVDFTDNNGVTTSNVERASNNITLAGINFTLLKSDAASTKTVTVSQDVDSVFDKIKSFIETYNKTIDAINTKLTEKKEYDYPPLTDDQKDSMSDDEITKWETKAKSGLVSGDSTLQGVIRDLRNSLSNAIPGLNSSFNQLSEFGISSSGYYDNGRLYIDETKLKQVIAQNPDEVTSFFTNSAQNPTGSTLSGVADVNGKDFKVTLNGSTQTITLSGTYDLGTIDGKANLIKQLNDQLQAKFGYNQINASIGSDNRIIFSSPPGYSFTLNAGTTNDALSSLGFADGTKYDASQKGVMVKIYDKLTSSIKTITNKAGSSSDLFDNSIIGKEIDQLDTDIDNENDRLTDVEDRYYTQFTTMETYIAKMNSQSSWLSKQS